MKRKSVISLIMAAAVAMSALAGCGNNGTAGNSETSGTQTKGNTDTEAPANTEGAESTAGEEVSYPLNSDVTLTYWTELNQNVSANYTNLGETPFGNAWQEQTGVSIEFMHPPANQMEEQFSLLLADGNLPDIMEYKWINYSGGPEKAIRDGVIIPLNDIIDEYCPNIKKYLEENPDVDKMCKTDEGTYYVFPFIRGDDTLCNSVGAMMRQDWLDDLGLEMPTTVDEWHDVLTAFKEEKGASAPFTWEYSVSGLTENNPIAYAYGTTQTFYVGKDGKVHFGAVEEGYKEYLATFAQWYQEGLIDQDLASLSLDQVSAKMTSGDGGASIGWAGSRMGTWINAAQVTNPDYMLAAAPYPTLEKDAYPEMGHVDNYYSIDGSAAITTSCENVELAARLLDYAYGEDGHMLFNFGVEDESYTMEGDYPTYTDHILENEDGWSVAQAMSSYIRGNYNGPFVQDARYLEQYYTIDTQKESNIIWGDTNAIDYKLPPITPTEDESKEFSTIMNEINTYRDEMTLKFIFGTESLDEFDNYVKTIENMGLERALEIQNDALERYNNR